MFNQLLSGLHTAQPQASHYTIGHHHLPIVRSARRKNIAVKQHNGVLVLAVPQSISTKRLNQVLQQNQLWLAKRIDVFMANAPEIFKGLHGESFMLFGQNYMLSWLDVELAPSSESLTAKDPLIDLCETSFKAHVYLNPALSEPQKQQHSRQALEQLFKRQAQSYFLPKLDFYAEKMAVKFRSVTVKGYKSRWGSCYSDGRIQFNWRLLQAPEWVIDYVIVHELAHLVHANHSKAFWDLVQKHYPQTPGAKKVIKQHGRAWIDFLA
ncbi:hypothetical protein THMIRHAM_16770 [Thiomicrorhabdus immobilis]|uniref:YgjP-like metallopeptidase domain-containing protein n=1 Tax=Thiomicrorhabdus immobilis TaxID=2791037 RepID=A0ABN6CXL8_9GAMM|nr:SprT family zinc-dependent metalloprotease [Thiomicrorhabdus immobilis]BCN93892.1 hypothetical protein THMIRHAM_16770 [Thiomicrorhabdus immobilis]